MENKTVKMVSYDTDGRKMYETTEPLRVYKWLAEIMIYRHRGTKDVRRIEYNEQYDGYIHATFYISNGVKYEITIPR